jgi:hypothetical protein
MAYASRAPGRFQGFVQDKAALHQRDRGSEPTLPFATQEPL